MLKDCNYSESKIQADIVTWYTNQYCLKHHRNRCMILSIPNGGTRHKAEAMTLKATGLLPGAPDLIVIHNWSELYWVKVKTEDGVQSLAQKDFAIRVRMLGFEYVMVRSLNEFKEKFGKVDTID